MKQFLYAALAIVLAASSARAAVVHAPASLYNLEVKLTDQSGSTHGLDLHSGKQVLIAMFYGSCPAACPLLIDTLRAIERAAPAAERKELRVLMISIDPARDTPAALHTLAQQRRVDASRWTLASTDDRSVRKIAALLNIQYRRLPDGEYNHSSIVTLLNPAGEIVIQSSVLGKADGALVNAIRTTPPARTIAASP